MKRNYTETSALRAIRKNVLCSNKTIKFDGKSGLTELGAIDYLTKKHGYKTYTERR